MNESMLRLKKKELHREMRKKGFGWNKGEYVKPSKEYIIQSEELSCIDMINSILCYQCAGYEDAEKVLEHEEKSHYNYLAKYVELLGRERVIALIQEQINSIEKIHKDVYSDDEGVSYNSIIWK